jgi:hypothetical protein
MRYVVRFLASALLCGAACTAVAQPAQIATMSLNVNQQSDCKGGTCLGKGKLAISARHSFDAPADTIHSMTADTMITVIIVELPVELKLSDDPNYTKGATSAHITKELPLEYFYGGLAQITADLTWNDRHMEIVVQAKGAGEGPIVEKLSKTKAIQAVYDAPLITQIETDNVAPFEQWDDVPINYMARGSSSESITGDTHYRRIDVLNTVELVN